MLRRKLVEPKLFKNLLEKFYGRFFDNRVKIMKISKQIYYPNFQVSMVKTKHKLFWLFLLISLLSFSNFIVNAQEDSDDEEFTQGDEKTRNNENLGDPFELFEKGQIAHEKGDYETALKFYDEAILAMPEFPEAEFQRGSIFQTLGKFVEAEKAFRRAIELKRDWTLPIAELGLLLVQKGEYLEAEEQLNKAIRLNNMSFTAYVALTDLKLKTNASKEDLKTLLGKLQYLTTKAKIPASIWASRGAIERSLGDFESAKTSIKRALAIDEKNSYALGESIELSILEGDGKGAVNNAKNLTRLYPNSIYAKVLLARAFHLDGQSAEAVKILDSIENPSADVTKLKSAIALSSNDSIETLEKVLETDAENVSVLGRLCIISRTENAEKALQYCQKASQLEPKEMNHAIGFGAALVKLKRNVEAVNLFKKLLAISPENYTIKANLATALFQLERFEEAKKEYQWIIEKQPDLAVAYYFLAISHDRLQEYLDAMANYQQFLRLADDSLQLEKDKVNLRLPTLQTQIKQGKGKK